MSKYRSTATAALLAAFALSNAAPSGAKGERDRLLPLASLAHSFDIAVRHAGGALEVRVDGSWLRVTPGDVTVSEDGVPMLRLTAAPSVRSGQLCISSRDVSMLLDVDAGVHSARTAAQHSRNAGDSFEVRTIATPTPRPTIAPATLAKESAALEIPEGRHLVGTVGFEMQRQANAQYYQFNAEGGTKNVRGAFYANGSPTMRPFVSGVVTVGAGTQHATFGSVTDPLYGSLFSQSGTVGASYENARGTTFTWANASFGDRRSVSLSHSRSGITDVAALVSDAAGRQLLVGRQYAATTRWGEFDRELWLSSRGAGAGVHYRSEGRLYTEARLGVATSGLPLIAGDAPNEADLGYQFSQSFGLRAGIAAAHSYGSRPFAQAYGRIGSLQLGLARMANESNIDLAIAGASARASVDYGRAGSSSFLNLIGDLTLPRGILEANAYVTQGNNSDTWLDYRLRRTEPSMTIGMESIRAANASRIAPTIGYTAPFPGSMLVGLELHPLLHGQGLRVSVRHQILALDSRARPRFVTVSLNAQTSGTVYAFVDGVRQGQLVSAAAKIAVPDGTHYVSLQSADGRFASPETRVVDGTPQVVSMPLWPVLEVQGAVRMPSGMLPALLGERRSLAGITLVVRPQDITVQTDENGNFDLPPQAIAPHSTIGADASTLPDGLALDAAQTIPESGRVLLRLKLAKNVQKVIF